MIRYIKETWKDLDKNIQQGERYEKNLRGITLVALLLVVVNVITGVLNLRNSYYSAAATSPAFIAAGLLILYFSHFRQNRKGAVITAAITMIVMFTYGTFNVAHGFTIYWTLLLPLAFGYFGSVKAGIGVSLYFLALYWGLFFTPLRAIFGKHYSDVVAQRFPLLYLADVVLTTFIMVQYHRLILRQMEETASAEIPAGETVAKRIDAETAPEGSGGENAAAGAAGKYAEAGIAGKNTVPGIAGENAPEGLTKEIAAGKSAAKIPGAEFSGENAETGTAGEKAAVGTAGENAAAGTAGEAAFRTPGNSKTTTLYNMIVPLVIILCLMITMIMYTTRVIMNVTISNIHEVGEDRISNVAAQMENYLYTTESVLWVTADTVDHMIRNGSTTEQILQYITEESYNQEEQFDENYTGIYGYIMGEYLDGVGWEPPEGYVPMERTWYTTAIEADGESAIVSPYVDAQTHSVIISISRMLSNGQDVLAMDVMMNRIQEMVRELQIKEKGYGFIVNRDGMIMAHRDDAQNGGSLAETEENQRFLQQITKVRNGYFETRLDGKKSTVFVREIMDQWFIVIAVSSAELYAEIWRPLTVNVLICLIIYALIAFFYFYGRKIEQGYSRRMEAMKSEEQRKEYETKVLKLEKEAADQANKAKSDFLAEMSHEIRTPINAVLGMNEMILRESRQGRSAVSADSRMESFDNIRFYAGNIESAGNNLLAIINDILDFSKIEAGRMDIVPGRYQLSSVLNYVSNIAYFRAREKELEYQVDVDESIPDNLYGDEVRVRQVIINLLNNALKYTDRGSIKMTVRGEAEAFEPGKQIILRISISDTGIGIKEDDLGKLFTKFQRVDLERNSTVEGTGLGLAITESLLDMMHGEIHAESTYGSGSTFTFTLPQEIVSCEPVGNIQEKFEKNSLQAMTYRESFRAPDARILIVDDTKINLTVATGLLKSTELRIETALSGEEAIVLAEKTPYDLILMDQRMPKMDGTEALHRIREQQESLNAQTPVICLTADAVIGAREKYLTEGFDDYLTKPIDSEALERMLIRYLPAEKVYLVQRDEAEENVSPEADEGDSGLYAPLRAAGIRPETGLNYCQGDEALYQTLLREYASSAGEKGANMQRCFESREWKDYTIIVHALKSSSKMIGAGSLSEKAARLEAAAGQAREAEILHEHYIMMGQYDTLVKAIRSVFPEGDTSPEPEEEILEFLPVE